VESSNYFEIACTACSAWDFRDVHPLGHALLALAKFSPNSTRLMVFTCEIIFLSSKRRQQIGKGSRNEIMYTVEIFRKEAQWNEGCFASAGVVQREMRQKYVAPRMLVVT